MAGKRTHTPTKAMTSAAKRGLELAKKPEVSNNDILDVSMKGGKKLAAGSPISDDHVRSMAMYHSGHMGACPGGDDAEGAEDALWGGQAGAGWAASRVAAMDATTLSQTESPDISKLLTGTDPFALEVYTRPDLLGEKVDLAKGEDGLIWAPILRSGTLACRPDPTSPTGRKQEPLVFVPGHGSNASEIGLADLLEAFDDEAVQHVTIPRTHRNDEFENTGFIKSMKIVDSTLRPGEKVLMAGHDFLDNEALERVSKGLIANRSCGILHGYQNTGTGKTYPHVVEHVALTNKPWVTGMAPYGSDVFADKDKVVPMLLSEERSVPLLIDDVAEPGDLPPKLFSTSTPYEILERELHLADVVWNDQDDAQPSLNQIQSQLYSALREMGRSPYWDEESIWFSVRDVKPSSALINVDYGGSDSEDAWVVPFSFADGQLKLSDFSQWTVVHQAWVADDDANTDKDEVQAIIASGDTALSLEENLRLPEHVLNLATLTAKSRKDLPDSAFVFPKTREYPIQDLAHGRNALSRAAQNETGTRLSAVRSAVYKKYPQLKGSNDSSSKTNASTSLPKDPLKRASALRLSGQQPHQQSGGAMPLTKEMLAQLNLDDASRAVLERQIQQDNTQLASDAAELERHRQKERTDAIQAMITKLGEVGFTVEKGYSGFLATVNTMLQADDGDAAVRLNLANQPGQSEHLTVTQIIGRMIDALPSGEAAATTALADKTDLLQTPLSGRPDLKPDPKDNGTTQEMTGDQLLAHWKTSLGDAGGLMTSDGIELALPKTPATTTASA